MAFTTFHNNWTGWAFSTSGQVDIISQATFLSENPTAVLPKDHVGDILKLTQTAASTSTALARSPTGLGIDHTAWRNIAIRSYVPHHNIGSVDGAGWNFQLLDLASTTDQPDSGFTETARRPLTHTATVFLLKTLTTLVGNTPSGMQTRGLMTQLP